MVIENSLEPRACSELDVVLNGCHSKREMLGMFTYRKLNALYVNPDQHDCFWKKHINITGVGLHRLIKHRPHQILKFVNPDPRLITVKVTKVDLKTSFSF